MTGPETTLAAFDILDWLKSPGPLAETTVTLLNPYGQYLEGMKAVPCSILV